MPVDAASIGAWLDGFYAKAAHPDAVIAAAVSGGADSMAMLHLTLNWAKDRPVHALIIDHALRAGSDVQARLAAKRAADMGAIAHIKTWQHDGVTTAIQERARIARYGLLGQLCDEIAAATLLVGHNQDDQAETIGMRQASGSGWRGLAGMRDYVRAPLWPQLNGMSIGRPLMPCSRAEIRAYCADHNIAFHDDPANESRDYARVRMRAALAADQPRRAALLKLGEDMAERREIEEQAVRLWLDAHMDFTLHGSLSFARGHLRDMPIAALADMIRIVSGQNYRADMVKIEALRAHIDKPEFATRTLGGAMVYCAKDAMEKDSTGKDVIGIARDPGAVLGRRGEAVEPLYLTADVYQFWDNRFQVYTDQEGVHVAPFWPSRRQLDKSARAALRALDVNRRKTVPGFFRGETLLAVPDLSFQAAPGEFNADFTASIMRF